MLMGDFNLTVDNKNLDMDCLIKKPTCFQSAKLNFSDLILINKKEIFKNSNVLEVGISNSS